MSRPLRFRRLRGPAFLILVGITALLNQWGVLAFHRSWPLYLILLGILMLAEHTTPAINPTAAAPVQGAYWRSLRRSSIAGPLLLLAIGVLALLVELGKLNASSLWAWYLHWWPLLLIAVGLIALGEWQLDRGDPYGRRHGYSAVAAILILLAIVAYANPRLRGFAGFGHHGDDHWVFHLWGSEHDSVHNLIQEIPRGATIEIQASRGDVTVTPSADNRIHVQSREVVYAANDADARSDLEALRPQLTVSRKSVTLNSGRRDNGRVDLIVEIPSDASATVTASRGDVSVQDLNTPVNVDAGRGDVKLNNLKGAAEARLGRGEFTAHTITGDLSLRGRFDDVSISDIDGRAILDGDFFGDTHIARVASQVTIHSNRTAIELARLPGEFSRDSGNITITNAAGPIFVATRAKDVTLTGITGDAHIENADGEITLKLAGQPGEIQVHNGNGAIQLNVPRDAGFTLQALARNGQIQSNLSLPVESMGRGQSISGTVGSGGPKVELIAGHGDIRIDRTDVTAQSDGLTIPTPGSKTPLRLQVPDGTAPVLKTQ